MKDTANLPTLTHLQDFDECGKVCQCLRNNPNISDSEIAKQTRLLTKRVAILRTYLEHELGLPKHVQEETPTLSAPSEFKKEVANAFDAEEIGYPVKPNMEYTGRISGISQNGAGVASINGFPCHILGAASGELVKFRIKKIEPGGCEAELVRVLQKTQVAVMPQAEEIVEPQDIRDKAEIGKRCIECHSPASEEDFETYDGLCKQCYYKRLQSEAAREERRSGSFGADRAGTW